MPVYAVDVYLDPEYDAKRYFIVNRIFLQGGVLLQISILLLSGIFAAAAVVVVVVRRRLSTGTGKSIFYRTFSPGVLSSFCLSPPVPSSVPSSFASLPERFRK